MRANGDSEDGSLTTQSMDLVVIFPDHAVAERSLLTSLYSSVIVLNEKGGTITLKLLNQLTGISSMVNLAVAVVPLDSIHP